MTAPVPAPGTVAVIVKGYPRLSETFITQEIIGLERRGVPLALWSLRHPTERIVHPMHRDVRAPVTYLPEYLHREPLRVLRALLEAPRHRGLGAFLRAAWRDARRDPTPNRGRRVGQALVMAREMPAAIRHLHVHYLHTPASVVRYAALLTGRTWSFSAHAKDIWTTPAWDLTEKLAEARWGVTCTGENAARLRTLAPDPGRVSLVYHGLDLARFPPPPPPSGRDGSDAAEPVRILSVGRAVEKKGFDDLIRALAALPADLAWRFAHVGGGERLPALEAQAANLGLSGRVAFLGPKRQDDVVALMREADLFVLPAKAASSGDQDGLPNVLMEAATQRLATVATRFAAIPEFIRDGQEGVLVPPGDWEALSNAVNGLARDPAARQRLGAAALHRLTASFQAESGLDRIAARLRSPTEREPAFLLDEPAA